jgi:hypothetical protein
MLFDAIANTIDMLPKIITGGVYIWEKLCQKMQNIN